MSNIPSESWDALLRTLVSNRKSQYRNSQAIQNPHYSVRFTVRIRCRIWSQRIKPADSAALRALCDQILVYGINNCAANVHCSTQRGTEHCNTQRGAEHYETVLHSERCGVLRFKLVSNSKRQFFYSSTLDFLFSAREKNADINQKTFKAPAYRNPVK